MVRRTFSFVAALADARSDRKPKRRRLFSITRLAILRAFAAISCAFLVASCNPAQHERMVAYGIGTDLYTPGMARDTANLNLYLGFLCAQAGFTALNNPQCPQFMGPTEWTLLVATGWNDIDARCDAYLAWLDNQRRTRLYVNAQVAHIRTLASGIFGVLDPGNVTVTIVGVALGFAQDTYNSYNNRILIDIEGSTVETIVIGRRLDFRSEFVGQRISVKPDAVRVLRDYMRICTPYAIKMSVNTYSRSKVTGGILLEEQEAQRLRESLVASIIPDATKPMAPPPEPPVFKGPDRIGSYEENLFSREIKEFQRAVCVEPTGELGPLGSPTRLAIKAKLDATDEILTDRKGILLRRILRDGPGC